jgi:AraC-like DNA-binding protein
MTDNFRAWEQPLFLAEQYRFAPGPVVPLPPHAHEAIQLCLNVGSGGSYRYRRATHCFAPQSLTVVNSGEAHSPGYQGDFRVVTGFQMLYFAPLALHALAAELADRPIPEPYFPDLVLGADAWLHAAVQQLHQQLVAGAPTLATDVTLLQVQTALLRHHVHRRLAPRAVPADHPAVRRARDYLHAHVGRDVSLRALADAACLSEYHLCRLFARRYGVAPNQYQIQLRLDQAKRLLLRGLPVGRVAQAVGFFDGSHLVRHFGRVVGLTPTRYRQRPTAEE